MQRQGILNLYGDFLPLTPNTPRITLGEGGTPLIKSLNLGKELGVELYFKFEGLNPTGSFKDRGMVMAVANALEKKSKAVICASTGNTSASAAAYAARFGLSCAVVVPAGNIALGKLAQALIYGAKVVAVDGNFDKALELVRKIAEEYPITLVNSVNPYRLEGQKTAAFEIVDILGKAPDYLAIPVGNAGNITAYWRGFKTYYEAKKMDSLPQMIGFEAEGAAPIVLGHKVENPQTVATAIRIGNPASWKFAVEAAEESHGYISAVSDEEILQAYRLLAQEEGLFVEPASAASVAGIIKKRKEGILPSSCSVVCVLTGHGLKDPNTAFTQLKEPVSVPAEEKAILDLIF
jgi:threonine synthase